MSKKKKAKHARNRVDPNQMAAEIRTELRGILRRMDDLRRPIIPELEESALGGALPFVLHRLEAHEAIIEDVITLAGMVWHLKDRLKRWLSACKLECTPTIEKLAEANKALLICGDLIDSKKHGGSSDRSGAAPKVGGIEFSPAGQVEIRYDGALKLADIRSSDADPIPFTVEIVSGDGQGTFGPAIDVISKAFRLWSDMIEECDLLGGSDPESRHLRRAMERFKDGRATIVCSE